MKNVTITTPSPDELENAAYAALKRRARTFEAERAVDRIVKAVEAYETRQALRDRARTDAARRGLRRAVEAFLGDLLIGAKVGRGGWIYRSRRPNGFSGEEVSHRSMTAAWAALEALGLIEIVDGLNTSKTVAWRPGLTPSHGPGASARFRATPALLELVEGAGVDLRRVGRLFQEDPPTALVVLRGTPRWLGGEKLEAKVLAFTRTPEVEQIEEQVRRINDFLAAIDIAGGDHLAFVRSFDQGDHAAFAWNKGGRLYSHGAGNYQSLRPSERLKMTLNGEAVAELDIKASHLTALHGLTGRSRELIGDDPYRAGNLPQWVVKAWIKATLGHEGHHKRWPIHALDFDEDDADQIIQIYAVEKVKEAVVARYPILGEWGTLGISWSDLIFAESQAVIATMDHLLTRYEVPSLPVHDSLLVPVSKMELGLGVLRRHYEDHCKISPRIEVKMPF